RQGHRARQLPGVGRKATTSASPAGSRAASTGDMCAQSVEAVRRTPRVDRDRVVAQRLLQVGHDHPATLACSRDAWMSGASRLVTAA
ncbi:hypothetical protein A7K94_0217465, partial [Modestobacter sp. VKM Ac-2676]